MPGQLRLDFNGTGLHLADGPAQQLHLFTRPRTPPRAIPRPLTLDVLIDGRDAGVVWSIDDEP